MIVFLLLIRHLFVASWFTVNFFVGRAPLPSIDTMAQSHGRVTPEKIILQTTTKTPPQHKNNRQLFERGRVGKKIASRLINTYREIDWLTVCLAMLRYSAHRIRFGSFAGAKCNCFRKSNALELERSVKPWRSFGECFVFFVILIALHSSEMYREKGSNLWGKTRIVFCTIKWIKRKKTPLEWCNSWRMAKRASAQGDAKFLSLQADVIVGRYIAKALKQKQLINNKPTQM